MVLAFPGLLSEPLTMLGHRPMLEESVRICFQLISCLLITPKLYLSLKRCFSLCIWKICLCVYLHSTCLLDDCGGQKRLWPLVVALGCGPPCRFWKSSPGPLEEQSVLTINEPSLQFAFFFWDRVSCSPGWPLAQKCICGQPWFSDPPPKCRDHSMCCRLSSAQCWGWNAGCSQLGKHSANWCTFLPLPRLSSLTHSVLREPGHTRRCNSNLLLLHYSSSHLNVLCLKKIPT